MPIDSGGNYTGTFFTLLNPYALLAGLVTLSLFTTHGAAYLALKTAGDVRERAHALMPRLGLVTAVLAVVFLGWTLIDAGEAWPWVTGVLAAVALLAALAANLRGRDGWSFVLMGVTILMAVATLFIVLFPDVMPATDPANSLTVTNASSTDYTLKVMTVVAVIFTPIVLLYQGWTYYVFRRRLGVGNIPAYAATRSGGQEPAQPETV